VGEYPMVKFLISLWPALVALIVFVVWRLLRRGKKAESQLSKAESRLWILTLILSLVIAVICIIVMGVSGENVRPAYDYRQPTPTQPVHTP
jgi:predicted Co/Zn/Cd cation transporter (cation efflux family)